MKVLTLAVVVSWTLYAQGICFSQNSRPGYDHPSGRSSGGSVTNVSNMSATLTDLFISVEKAKTNSEKADAYFFLSRFYADRLKIDSAIFYSEKVKEESDAAGYEKGIGKYYLSKAYALYYRNQGDAEMLDKAIQVFNRHRDKLFSGYAYKQLARQYDHQKDYAASRKNYHSAASLLSGTGELKELQRVYNELGRSFYLTFERDSALFYLITALQLAEKLNDTGRIFYTSGMLGELYLATDDLVNAAKYLKYALDTRTPATSRIEVRNRLSSYAGCLLLLGEFEKSGAIIREYEAINEKLGDNWGVINLNKLKGTFYYYKGDYDEALTHLREAFSRLDEIKYFTFDVKNICMYLAKTEYRKGLYDSALVHFTYARNIAASLAFGADLMESTQMVSQCHQKKGNTDSAYQYFLVYDRIKDSIFTFRKERAVIELTTRYETEKKEHQIQLLQREGELSAYQLRSKMDEIEKQKLLDQQKSQQLSLLSQQNEISRLEASEKTLAYANQQKEMIKKQNELTLLAKENELQAAVAAKEGQRKNFAYIAIAAILFFSGYVFYRYAQNRKLSRRLQLSLAELKQAQEQLIKTEKEKEAENIRVRISRDIHDEVGATLSGVALFSEIAREKMQQHREDDVQLYLDHITVNSKEMVDKMSDIVWAINPDNDSFERIITKLQSYAFNLCAGKGISLHTSIDDRIREFYPPMQVKRNLYLFMKEAINNAVKYSEGKNIFLSLQNEHDRVAAEIRDDGKGFDSHRVHEGNGLNNMKARAGSLNGKFIIDSENGRGTSIRLQFDFHPAGGQPAAL